MNVGNSCLDDVAAFFSLVGPAGRNSQCTETPETVYKIST